MKKITPYLMSACLALSFAPLHMSAATNDEVSPKIELTSEQKEIDALVLRIDQIHAMDKSDLTSAEKKALRKEVKYIKHRVNSIGNGVYISTGAIILIVILILILF